MFILKKCIAVVAEIEQLWCFPFERYDAKKHPSYIYYYAHTNDVREQEQSTQNEVKNIIQELDKIYDHGGLETSQDDIDDSGSTSSFLHLDELFYAPENIDAFFNNYDCPEPSSDLTDEDIGTGQGHNTNNRNQNKEIEELKSKLVNIEKVLTADLIRGRDEMHNEMKELKSDLADIKEALAKYFSR
jgi:hypothetical protein